jgi:uncharacterized membrane protein YuzA (DUF378 family)
LILGGLNWGVYGLTPDWFNVVDWLSPHKWIDRIFYWIVGFSAIWWLFAWKIFITPKRR